MAKETVKETAASLGTIKIAENVVSTIATLAASEVEGVVVQNKKSMERSVSVTNNRYTKVDVIGDKVKVDIGIVVDYGFNIPATSQKVQSKVQSTIESMTGLQVTDVNVRILSVHVN